MYKMKMYKRILNRIKLTKTYSQTIGLQKGDWVLVLVDFIFCKFHYGFSDEDYFEIGNGYTLSRYEKRRFFSLGKAYQLCNNVNDTEYIHFLENKSEALNLFKDLVFRNWIYPSHSQFDDFLNFCKKTPFVIAKPVCGMKGKGIKKYDLSNKTTDELYVFFSSMVKEDMLLEECLRAHDEIFFQTQSLSTFRIYTMIDKQGNVHILKAKYRVGTGSALTDTSDGCIAYPISIQHGVIEGPGINEVLMSDYYYYHPGFEKCVVGMKIPLWEKALDLVREAAKKIPQIRYVGWDIAITNTSVEIIEGNHNPYHGTFEIMGTERLWWPHIKSLI